MAVCSRALSSRLIRADRAPTAATQIMPTGKKITIITSRNRRPSAPSLPANRKNAPEMISQSRLSAAAVSSIPLSPPEPSTARLGIETGPGRASFCCAISRPDPSDIFDLEHFVGLVAPRRAHLDAVTLFLADQGAGDGGFDVEKALFDVGLVFADDLPGLFLVGVLVHQRHGRAELDRARKLGEVDHFDKAENAFEFLDAAFDEALLFARRVVFGVFLQVAQFARLGNRLDHGGTLFGLERFKFGFQRGMARAGHR